MKEKTLYLLMIGLLALTTFIDLYTALRSPIFHVAEANPLKVYLGNTLLVVTIILLITVLASYYLKTQVSLQMIFAMSTFFIYVIAGHLIGAYYNIEADSQFRTHYDYEDNVYQQDSSQYRAVESKNNLVMDKYKRDYEKVYPDKKAVVTTYFSIVGLLVGVPMFLNWIAFYVAFSFYHSRRDKREVIVGEIYKKAKRLQ